MAAFWCSCGGDLLLTGNTLLGNNMRSEPVGQELRAQPLAYNLVPFCTARAARDGGVHPWPLSFNQESLLDLYADEKVE